jgi:hypothetical protein
VSTAYECDCGLVFQLAEDSGGRITHCLRRTRPVKVPITQPEPPPAAPATGVQAAPPEPSALRSGEEDREVGIEGGQGIADSYSMPLGEVPSVKRGFNLTDLALIGGGGLMAAAFFWYFLGYRLFGGDRLYPTALLFFAGLSFLVKTMFRDMQN